MIDLILAIVIAVALLLGLLRGLIGIVVPVAAWVLAGGLTIRYGDWTALWLSGQGQPSMMEYAGGYALSFFVVLVVVLLLGMALKSLIRSSPLSGADRAIGGAIGFVTGVSIACVAVALMSYTSVVEEPAWQASLLRRGLEPGADWIRARLPEPEIPALPELLDLDGLRGEGAERDERLSISRMENAASQLLGNGQFRQSSESQIMPIPAPAKVEGMPGEGASASSGALPSQRGGQSGRVERRTP